MFREQSNADALARRYKKRARKTRGAVRKGLRRIAERIDLEQAKNLRGGDDAAPGSYPVPIRTGNLFQSRFYHVQSDRLAVVGNAAFYAGKIHETRPFLDDAAAAVDELKIMSETLEEEVLAV